MSSWLSVDIFLGIIVHDAQVSALRHTQKRLWPHLELLFILVLDIARHGLVGAFLEV